MFYRGAMARVNQSELTKLGREIGHLLRFFIFAVHLSTKLSVSMGWGGGIVKKMTRVYVW